MYCVIGEKILKCEVVEKLEGYAWCKIGTAKKNKSVPSTRIFTTEEAARDYLKKKSKSKQQQDIKIKEEVAACEAIYKALYEECGITVRTIDRKWRAKEAQADATRRKKKYLKEKQKKELS